MDTYLEVWGDAGADIVGMSGDRMVIGRAADNEVALEGDPTVSRVHAVLERYAAGWSIRDMGAANGTQVNGVTVTTEQALHSGDELRVGSTRIVYRAQVTDRTEATAIATEKPPILTRREHDVLVSLCRPVIGPGTFTQPATSNDIAQELVVSEATVKFHLANLYDKFDIGEPGTTRRSRLAEAALVRGAVQRAELKQPLRDP